MAKTKSNRFVRFTIFTEAKDQVFFGDSGEVSTFTKGLAEEVLERSREHIGTEFSGEHGSPLLKNSGSIKKGPAARWSVIFRHRAAEVHYVGAKPHMMRSGVRHYRPPGAELDADGIPLPYEAGGGFGPVLGPFRHPGHAANRYIEAGARDVGLIISQRPTGFSRTGFARIPRGFA